MKYTSLIEWFDEAPNVGLIRVWPEGGSIGDPYVWVCTLVCRGEASAYLTGFVKAPTIDMCRAMVICLKAEGFTTWSRNKVMSDKKLHLREFKL